MSPIIQFPTTLKKLNLKLTKAADWLKLNKLSINIKIQIIGIRIPQKQVNIPNIEIENIKIEFAHELIFQH